MPHDDPQLLSTPTTAWGPSQPGQARHQFMAASIAVRVARLLNVAPRALAIEASLIALGLTSLQLLRLAAEIRNDLGVNLALQPLFIGASINEIAQAVLSCFRDSTLVAEAKTKVRSAEWPILRYSNAGGAAAGGYHTVVWGLKGSLALSAARTAFRELVSANVLHLSDPIVGSGVDNFAVVSVADSLGEPALLARVETLVAEWAQRQGGPVFHVTVFVGAQSGSALVFACQANMLDVTSLRLLVYEYFDRYCALTSDGLTVPLPPDSAGSLQLSCRAATSSDTSYWRTFLARSWPGFQWPSISATENVADTGRIAEICCEMDAPATRRLVELACKQNATLATLCLATFNIALHKLLCLEDLLLLLEVDLREVLQQPRALGRYLFPVPIRTSPVAEKAIVDYLHEVADAVGTGLTHGLCSVNAESDGLLGSELPSQFRQVTFGWWGPRPPTEDGLTNSLDHCDHEQILSDCLQATELVIRNSPKTPDLSFTVQQYEKGLRGRLRYRCDRLSQHVVSILAQTWVTAANALTEFPLAKISDLPDFSVAPSLTSLPHVRGIELDIGDAPSILEVFTHQAHETPDATALSHGEETLSYSELDARSSRLAQHLRIVGAGVEQVVAICVRPSLELVLSILGVLKSGAGVILLDPSAGSADWYELLELTQPVCVLVQADPQIDLVVPDCPMLCVDATLSHWRETSVGFILPSLLGQSLAYVHYGHRLEFGGSLRIGITHLSLQNRVFWMQQVFRLRASDKVLLNGRNDDGSLLVQLLWSVLGGATAVIPTAAELEAHSQRASVLSRQSITILNIRSLQELHDLQPTSASTAWHPREVICWEEDWGTPLADSICSATECGTVHLLHGFPELGGHMLLQSLRTKCEAPQGHAVMANSLVYVLDENMQPLPAGMEGFLCLGGLQTGRGYLDRPDLTAQYFVPNPDPAVPGERLFCSGVRGRLINDGMIEIVTQQYNSGRRNEANVAFRNALTEQASELPSHEKAALTPLMLPPRRTRIALDAHNYGYESLSLSDTASESVSALAEEYGVAATVIVHAAWLLTLARFTGQREIVCGWIVAAKSRPLFAQATTDDIAVLRVRFTPEASVRAWLQTLVAGIAATSGARGVSPQYWPHILFSLRHVEEPEMIMMSYMRCASVEAGPSLGLLAAEGGRISIGIMYDKDVFEDFMITRAVRYCRDLLLRLIESQYTSVGNLGTSVANRAGKGDASADLISSVIDALPHYVTIFEQQVRARPTSVAARNGAESLTYDALNRRANRIASALRQVGVGPNIVVAVLDDRGLDLLVMTLAVLKAGGAFLLLPTRTSVGQCAELLESGGASILLAGVRWKSRLQSLAPSTVMLYLQEVEREELPNLNLTPLGSLLNAAYVVISGTKEQPLAVTIQQRSLVIDLANWTKLLNLTSADIVAQSALQTDGSFLWQTLATLAAGGCVDILPDGVGDELSEFARILRARNISVAECQLNATVDRVTPETASAVKARWLVFTDVHLPSSDLQRIVNLFVKSQVLVAWSQLHCGGVFAAATPKADADEQPVQYSALMGYSLCVVDSCLDPLPPGAFGDVYVSGLALACSYIDRPALAAVTFVPCPCGVPGQLMFALGRQGRILETGELELAGIRTQRIDLGENTTSKSA